MILTVTFDADITNKHFNELYERIKHAVQSTLDNNCLGVYINKGYGTHEKDIQPGYLGFSQLTESNRADLCDIAWFLKGLKQGNPDIPLMGCHDDSLRKVIMSIADRIDADKNKINGK